MSLKKQLVIAAKERAEFARLYRNNSDQTPQPLFDLVNRAAAERRDEKVRELVEAAEAVRTTWRAMWRLPMEETFEGKEYQDFQDALQRQDAAIAAVRDDLK